MECATRARLERQHNRADARFDTVRKRLNERIGVCLKEEFLALSDELDRESETLDHARAALDNHIRQHCCLTRGTASQHF